MPKNNIKAFLGPTNTGKTFLALKRLFSHTTGLIGFPLRLLARENYELAKTTVGEKKVALITGEEKIIPNDAKYFFCTVESIPKNLNFSFVAIDEIQLCSDFERGHIFTEKLLNYRGINETLYLGSRSIENILKKIYPEIKIKYNKRFSKLTYCGYKNLSRLPKRSAVIAFSQVDVYEIAEKLKQFYGGVSVIMGALSPDVRNAQVKLFEDGKVDYMVATDAIGLGLNLNIKNIFFSNLVKYDGTKQRYLSYDEISQIAGRAGRFQTDGSFGTTYRLKSLSTGLVNFVENLEFNEIKKIFWRNSQLNFTNSSTLKKSLNMKPKESYFRQKRNAKDHNCLIILLKDTNLINKYNIENHILLLWEVCSIPDYTNFFDDLHTRFVKKIFILLLDNRVIPNFWIDGQIEKIQRKTPKISELNLKIAQIRVWSFISFKKDWLMDASIYQKKVRKIETSLSTYLHDSLTNQFIGEFRKVNSTNKEIELYQKNPISIFGDSILFGKQNIGEIKGLSISITQSFRFKKKDYNAKLLKNSLVGIVETRVNDFIRSDFSELKFEVGGKILWKNFLVGEFSKGEKLLNPNVTPNIDNYFANYESIIKYKLDKYLKFCLRKYLHYVVNTNSVKSSSSSMRAILFMLSEGLGHCTKKNFNEFYNQLTPREAKKLKDLGFKNGINFFYHRKSVLNFFGQMLINIFYILDLKNFIKREIFKLDQFNSIVNNMKYFQQMGFYLVKVNKKQNYLVHCFYLENLMEKVFRFKRKNIVTNFSEQNFHSLFEKVAYSDIKKLDLCSV